MAAHAITRCRLPDGRIVHLLTDAADHVVGDTIRRYGGWEPTETAWMQALATPGDTIADIGAHVGYCTVLLSRCVGPTGRVVAFEPEPSNFELLKANCILNGCTNVSPKACAVADRSGHAELYLATWNLGDHRLHATAGRSSRKVAVVRFDDCWQRRRLDFMKLDAQGTEPAILRGASETIRANADRLLCLAELSPGLCRAAGHELDPFLALLARLAARVFRITGSVAGGLERLDDAALTELWHALLADRHQDANASLLLAFSDASCERLRAHAAAIGRGVTSGG